MRKTQYHQTATEQTVSWNNNPNMANTVFVPQKQRRKLFNAAAELAELPDNYQRLVRALQAQMDSACISINPILNYAFASDASFYQLTPKVVVFAQNEPQVQLVITCAAREQTPLTFRAAGTSLSGQALSDSVLVVCSHDWQAYQVAQAGQQIRLQPGLIGSQVNRILAPYGRKIGPDPASIDSCMIGGIINNNSSGMCCGVTQNSYQTLASVRVILPDGTVLDTGDAQSRTDFTRHHGDFLIQLKTLAARAKLDSVLSARITRKYQIKNTTGYSLNALLDFSDPFDLLAHLIVGSEGTLAFLSEVVLNTVVAYQHKATAFVVFQNLADACTAIEHLRQGDDVMAAELMDYASIASVQSLPDLPDFLRDLPREAVCLLIEAQDNDESILTDKVSRLTQVIEAFQPRFAVHFSRDPKDYDCYWKIRKGMLPSIGAARKTGSSILTEDVVFPLDKMVEGTLALRELLDTHGFADAGIVGHALSCNLHFIITPDVSDRAALAAYTRFMDALAKLVCDLDGSLKGEHGTGRNMAPFVEQEWGETAYALMWDIKRCFDPNGLFNPDVLLSTRKNLHLENLKLMPAVDPLIDKCMECGFCESVCPSKRLTLSPRQRIAMQRYLHLPKLDMAQRVQGEKIFAYYGEQTCATTGLCSLRCPVGINTGEFILSNRRGRVKQNAFWPTLIRRHYGAVLTTGRWLLQLYTLKRQLFGDQILGRLQNTMARWTPLPAFHAGLPKSSKLPNKILGKPLLQPLGIANQQDDSSQNSSADTPLKVVYFTSCMNQVLGEPQNQKASLAETLQTLCQRAGYEIISLTSSALCCGKPFASKGLTSLADDQRQTLLDTLQSLSESGCYPIVIDAASCSLELISAQKDLPIIDSLVFAHDYLLPRLAIQPLKERISLHITCASQRLFDEEKTQALAQALAQDVVISPSVSCCGFSGDKGFFTPELNESALQRLATETEHCSRGYSNNKTCEIGLNKATALQYQSLLFLLEEASREPARP